MVCFCFLNLQFFLLLRFRCADTQTCVEKNANGKICEVGSPNCIKCARSGMTEDARCFPLVDIFIFLAIITWDPERHSMQRID